MSSAKMKIDRNRKANEDRMLEQMRRTTIFLALGTSLVLAVAEPGWLIATQRQAPVTSHVDAEKTFQHGQVALQANDLEIAEADFQKLLQAHPESAAAYVH